MRPINDTVVVKKLREEKVSSGGVIIYGDDTRSEGEVIFADAKTCLKPGDQIIFDDKNYRFYDQDEKLFYMTDAMIAAVIK